MSEHDQQAALVSWFNLQYRQYRGCLFAIPNGTHLAGNRAQRGIKMKKLKAEGFKTGVSDLFLCVPSGDYHGLFLEMKDKGKTQCHLSDQQKAHLELVKKHGYAGEWAAGFDEGKKVIEQYLQNNRS